MIAPLPGPGDGIGVMLWYLAVTGVALKPAIVGVWNRSPDPVIRRDIGGKCAATASHQHNEHEVSHAPSLRSGVGAPQAGRVTSG